MRRGCLLLRTGTRARAPRLDLQHHACGALSQRGPDTDDSHAVTTTAATATRADAITSHPAVTVDYTTGIPLVQRASIPRSPDDLMTPENFEPLLSDSQVGQMLGLHPKTVQRLARKGELPAVRIGRYWRFRASQLNLWVDVHSTRQPLTSERTQ